MPPLSKTLRGESPKGFVAAAQEMPESSPTPQMLGKTQGANPYIRTPLPPFNATVDTLRQFGENGAVPTRRVIPLPPSAAAGGSTTVINNTSISSSGGGSSGSSGGGTVATAKTATVSVPTLLPGDSATITLVTAKVAILMILGASDLCEVRVYGDSVSQAADTPRASDTAPAFETTQGLVTDVVLDTLPLQYNWQNRVFVNQDTPQTQNMYVTILNPSLSAVTPTITVTYLPLE